MRLRVTDHHGQTAPRWEPHLGRRAPATGGSQCVATGAAGAEWIGSMFRQARATRRAGSIQPLRGFLSLVVGCLTLFVARIPKHQRASQSQQMAIHQEPSCSGTSAARDPRSSLVFTRLWLARAGLWPISHRCCKPPCPVWPPQGGPPPGLADTDWSE